MKSILVGKIADTKVYYIVDSIHKNADCILVGRLGTKEVTNFWEFVNWNKGLSKMSNTEFHQYLWNGHQSKSSPYWYSIFVEKSLPVEQNLLVNVVVNNDVMNRRAKIIEYENRAMDFSVSLSSQVVSSKTLAAWATRRISESRRRRGKNHG